MMEVTTANITASAAESNSTVPDRASAEFLLFLFRTAGGISYGVYSLVLLGGIGNWLAVWCVLARKELRTAFNCLVVLMAVSDILVCYISTPFRILRLTRLPKPFPLTETQCLLQQFCDTFSITVSTICITAVAVVRMRIACSTVPRHVKKLDVVFIACAALFIGTVMGAIRMDKNSTDFRTCRLDNRERESIFPRWLQAWYIQVTVVAVCLIVTVSSYIICVVRYRILRTAILQPATQQKYVMTQRVGIMVTVVFLITWSPPFILAALFHMKILDRNTALAVVEVTVALVHVQSAANPVIYAWNSKAFRRGLKSLVIAKLRSLRKCAAFGRVNNTEQPVAIIPEPSLVPENHELNNALPVIDV